MKSGSDAGGAVLFCRTGQRWRQTVSDIMKGAPFAGRLREFLRDCGPMFDLSGVVDVDHKLIHTPNEELPPERMSTDPYRGHLNAMENEWRDIERAFQRGSLPAAEALQRFVKFVSRYLRCYARGNRFFERQRSSLEQFWRDRGFDHLEIPPLPFDDVDFGLCSKAGRDLIYRPSEEEAPVERLKQVLPYDVSERTLGVIWQPAKQGYWYLVDGGEDCPRAGEASYQEFNKVQGKQEDEEKLVDPLEYLIFWHCGGCGGAIPDLTTGTMLRTRLGGRATFARGNIDEAPYRVVFGTLGALTEPDPEKGVRFRRIIT